MLYQREKMMKNENSNEQLILEAAEEEFLEKGYAGSKTTAIAQKAGVTHTMLHYYFRTKEKLFQKVFQEKVHLIGDSFSQQINDNLSLEEILRKFIEFHFDFIQRNPRLLNFVYNEVVLNKGNRTFLLEQIAPKITGVFGRIEKLLTEEIAKGKVRPIRVYDLMLNIVSINIVTFMLLPILGDLLSGKNSESLDRLILERRESNVRFILNALRI